MDISNGIGYTITLDNKQVQQILRQTKQDFESFNTHVQNQFTQTTGVVNTLAKGVAAFLTVDYATQFVSQLVKVRGEFEQLEIAFTTMLGSKEKADSLMQEIVTFAATTPFGLQSTSEATKMLLAYGESADTALDTMRKLGDIASGVGIPLKDIAYLYGTTMTQGRLYTQDLNQFLGRGIPMMDELAKILGVSKNEVKGLVEAGKVGFPEVQKVIENLTASGSMFGGLMEAQSKSVAGQIEQLKDAVDVMFNEIGKDSQGFVTSVIGGASSVVENYEAIGKTIAVLVATYGTYKAVLIVLNVIEKARLTTTLAIGAAEGRVTAMQALRYISTLKLTAAQTALNAAMMANPYAIVITAVVALGTAYFLLRDTTTAAEKAQEAYNKTQEEVKSKLDETKQKAEEYINILKDETATVYQQLQAYKALQLLKLKGIENLTQEQIATMDLTELRKLLNAAYDDKSLTSQESELNNLYRERERLTKEISDRNKDSKGVLNSKEATSELISKLEVIEIKYQKQLDLVNKTKHEQQLANLPLRDRYQYWENEIKKIEEAISENENLNFGVKSTNPLIKDNTDAANIFKIALQSVNINPLLAQLGEANKQFSAIKAEMGGAAIPEIKNKAYYDKYQKEAQFTLDNLDLNDPKNAEKIKALRTIIEGTTNALKKYNNEASKTKTPKSIKPTKKSDDPFEIYKKQIQSVKEDYERFVDYMNSDDLVLKNSGKIQYESLSKSGATYEEFLRRLQKQLVETSNKSALQVKQLQFINDELLKTIDYNAFDKFKEGIENSISESENLLEVLGKIQEEKLKLKGNTDQISIDKIKFLDEKEIENIKKADDAAKDLIKTLTEEFNPLDAINKKYDEQINLLKEKLKTAKDEVEKTKIKVAIEQVEAKRTEALEDTPTNDKYVNEILKKYQTLEQKKQQIKRDSDNEIKKLETEMFNEVDSEKIANYTATIEEIKTKQKEALQAVDSEILKKSKGWIQIFGDYSNKSGAQLRKILDQIRTELNNPNSTLSEQDKKAYQDQFKGIKEKLEKDNPFDNLIDSFNVFKEGVKKGFKDIDGSVSLDSIRGLIGDIQGAINETLSLAEDLGINVSESTKDAVQLGSDLFNAGAGIAEGIASKDPVKIIQGLAKAVKSVLNFNDKKKQRQIKQYQQAVDDLARSFKNLQYETDKALGGDTYKNQRTMLDNLTKQQEEYRKMIKTEQSRKKTDNNKIKEWEQAIVELEQSKRDLLDSLAQDILQTNAKDLANTLGDALAEAFGKGEDAAKSFEKVANDVLKNAVLNQLKKRFIEEELQKALDQLEKDMGVDEKGWNGLSPEEQQEFRDKIKEISQNFQGALEQYSDLFKDLVDPNENSLSGAIKGVSEETASLIAGQVNAMRLLIVEANKTRIDTNRILLQSLDRLANIDYNTRSVLPLLEKLINRIDNAGRAYGF